MPDSLRGASTEESHLEAARELMLLVFSEEVMSATTHVPLDALLQSNPALENLRPVFFEFFSLYFTRDVLSTRLAPVYVNRFTELELRQIAWFYETPTGRKSLVELPSLMASSGDIGRSIVEEHRSDLERMIQKHLRTTRVPSSSPEPESVPQP